MKNAAILSPVLTFLPSYLRAGATNRLRTGFIGLGPWGQQYLSHALHHRDIDVIAIADTNTAAISQSLQLFSEAGYSHPSVYDNGYTSLLARTDIDAVIIAAPWQLHYQIAKAALLAGKHVACGPIMGTTLEEHLDIVQISRQTGRQYFTLEENSYRKDLLTVANMVKGGVFGALESVRAGARHDQLLAENEDLSPYPVYPALAATRLLDVSKHNPFTSLQVVSEKQDHVINKPDPKTGLDRLLFRNRAVNTIRLTTQKGQTLSLQLDAGTDQPISTGFQVTGTNGDWLDLIDRIRLDNVWEAGKTHSTPYEQVADLQRFKKVRDEGYALALQEFVNRLRDPKETTVQTAAVNSMIGPLASLSTARGGAVIDFPNFY